MMTIAFYFIAFLSQVFGTLTGFGSSVLFVPFASMIYDFKTVLILTSILHVFGNVSQLILFRNDLDWNLVFKMAIPSIIFVLIGAYLNEKVELTYVKLIMGIFLLCFALLMARNKAVKLASSNGNILIGGSLSGFFTGLIGTGGAIRGAALATMHLPKNTFVGTSAAIDLFSDLSRTVVYFNNGYLKTEFYWYVPALLTVAMVGSYIGKKLLSFTSEKTFRVIVLLIIFGSGVTMIYDFFRR